MLKTLSPATIYYQPSTISTWVKNVYSLCVEGVVTRVPLSPTTKNNLLPIRPVRVQLGFSTITMDSFAPASYTAFFYQLPDTTYHLSTLSTAPTIKKNKKK